MCEVGQAIIMYLGFLNLYIASIVFDRTIADLVF